MLGREELLLAVPQQVEQVEQVEQLRRVEEIRCWRSPLFLDRFVVNKGDEGELLFCCFAV